MSVEGGRAIKAKTVLITSKMDYVCAAVVLPRLQSIRGPIWGLGKIKQGVRRIFSFFFSLCFTPDFSLFSIPPLPSFLLFRPAGNLNRGEHGYFSHSHPLPVSNAILSTPPPSTQPHSSHTPTHPLNLKLPPLALQT